MNDEFLKDYGRDLALRQLKAGQPLDPRLAGFLSQKEEGSPFLQMIGLQKKAPQPTLADLSDVFSATESSLLKKAEAEKEKSQTEGQDAMKAMLEAAQKGIDPQKVYEIGKVEQQLQREALPFEIERKRIAADEAVRQSTRQLAAAYPFLSAAGREATERALEASQRYRAFKESMPTTAQDIMASKQQQQLAAQAGEADLMRAVAAQQQAAKQFAGTFAGKYISAG